HLVTPAVHCSRSPRSRRPKAVGKGKGALRSELLPTERENRMFTLQGRQTPGHPGHASFRAAFPTAQRLACLRISRDVATPAARLATGLPGSALAGRDFHPLDDKPNLRKSPHDFLLLDQHCLVALPLLARAGDPKAGSGSIMCWCKIKRLPL